MSEDTQILKHSVGEPFVGRLLVGAVADAGLVSGNAAAAVEAIVEGGHVVVVLIDELVVF